MWTEDSSVTNGDERMEWMMSSDQERMATTKKDEKPSSVWRENRSLTFEDSDRLLVFLFSCSLVSVCVKCVVTGKDDMNYLKVICEMKVMPV